MKNFLIGIQIVPAIAGLLFMYHTLIAEKSGLGGAPLTNRLARVELVWLAMNKPRLFLEQFPQLALDVEERHGLDERMMLGSGALDPDFFVARNPHIVAGMSRDRDLVGRYWLGHLDECLPSSPSFDVQSYMKRNPDVRSAYGGDCRLATTHWVKWGKREGRSGAPESSGSAPRAVAPG